MPPRPFVPDPGNAGVGKRADRLSIAASAAFFFCGECRMHIILNGERSEQQDGLSIAGLLAGLGIGLERVAVEVNLDIVPKANYDTRMLSDGDRIEIVHFVGGG